jgi:hypothetical protein
LAGGHSHPVNPPSTTTSSDGLHDHEIRVENDNGYTAGFVRGASDAAGGSDSAAPILSDGAHTHTVDIASFNSGTAPNHSHPVDVAPFNSSSAGAASVDVTMPYVQLIACEKQ